MRTPKTPRCDQCDSCYINGIYCHEIGCPNTHKVYDQTEERWIMAEPDAPDFDDYDSEQ